jgi:hypothetical protein
MAVRWGTFDEVAGREEMVVAVRVVDGTIIVSKSILPAKVRACKAYITPPAYLKFFPGPGEPTAVDKWFQPWKNNEERIHIAVIQEWTAFMPRIFFCMLHPDVRKIKAVPLADNFRLYTQLMQSGMRPNQLRDFLGKELDRNAFYRAFRDIEKTLTNRQRAGFLKASSPFTNAKHVG